MQHLEIEGSGKNTGHCCTNQDYGCPKRSQFADLHACKQSAQSSQQKQDGCIVLTGDITVCSMEQGKGPGVERSGGVGGRCLLHGADQTLVPGLYNSLLNFNVCDKWSLLRHCHRNVNSFHSDITLKPLKPMCVDRFKYLYYIINVTRPASFAEAGTLCRVATCCLPVPGLQAYN